MRCRLCSRVCSAFVVADSSRRIVQRYLGSTCVGFASSKPCRSPSSRTCTTILALLLRVWQISSDFASQEALSTARRPRLPSSPRFALHAMLRFARLVCGLRQRAVPHHTVQGSLEVSPDAVRQSASDRCDIAPSRCRALPPPTSPPHTRSLAFLLLRHSCRLACSHAS